jgi:diaminohydroxyphosphoribosylaminopyrimidine deaminase/5-amino-6-(5-phosphoribosylamino)uracil reductase
MLGPEYDRKSPWCPDRAVHIANGGVSPTGVTRSAEAPPSTVQAVTASDLFAPFRSADPAEPFVVAQIGQSLDGRIATVTGESRYINRAAALDHLHAIRANVDAVVVGIGTVLSDDPLLTVRRVAGQSPARVVIDPSERLGPEARCLNADGAPCFVVRRRAGTSICGAEILVIDAPDGRFAPSAIVAALFARGMRRILVEGGARTISAFVDDRAVDRLHVLVAPLIIGSGRTGLDLAPVARLSSALRPASRVHVFADGDVLFDCDLRRPRQE